MTENEIKIEEPKIVDTRLTSVKPAAEIISFVEIESRVVLHKGMFCLVHCYDANKVQLKTYSVELTSQEYSDWVDDEAMEALILSKAGLVKNS